MSMRNQGEGKSLIAAQLVRVNAFVRANGEYHDPSPAPSKISRRSSRRAEGFTEV